MKLILIILTTLFLIPSTISAENETGYNWDWSGKTPQQITTADITYLTITLQDMTKPGGQ